MEENASKLPLEGIVVLDFANILAGGLDHFIAYGTD